MLYNILEMPQHEHPEKTDQQQERVDRDYNRGGGIRYDEMERGPIVVLGFTRERFLRELNRLSN